MWACFALGGADVVIFNVLVYPGRVDADTAAAATGSPRDVPASGKVADVASFDFVADAGNRAPGSLVVSIVFASESALLDESPRRLVDALALEMKLDDDLAVRLDGHSDARGDPFFNQELSARRAEAVRDRLVADGIDQKRIVVRALGTASPRTLDPAPEAQALNRRVEVYRAKVSP